MARQYTRDQAIAQSRIPKYRGAPAAKDEPMADAPLVGEPLAELPLVDLVVDLVMDLVMDLDLTEAGGSGLISACGQLDQPIGARVGERAAEGCRHAGGAWIGGETSDMSGLPELGDDDRPR
jgi:hypothetical protein